MAQSTHKKTLKQQPAFKKLSKLLKQTGVHGLLWYHQAGECVERLFPSEEGRHYGDSRMTQIAVALGESEMFANTLWHYRDFSCGYRRDEVKQLCDPRNTGGFQLSWTHIKCLLVVDKDNRAEFQDACIRQEWSTDQLRQEIQTFQGRKSAGGRPFDRPKTLAAGLRQMIDESNTWIRRHRQVWFDDDQPVICSENDQENPELIPDLVNEAIKCWKEMARLVKEDLPRLQEMERWFKKMADEAAEQKSGERAKPKKKTRKK